MQCTRSTSAGRLRHPWKYTGHRHHQGRLRRLQWGVLNSISCNLSFKMINLNIRNEDSVTQFTRQGRTPAPPMRCLEFGIFVLCVSFTTFMVQKKHLQFMVRFVLLNLHQSNYSGIQQLKIEELSRLTYPLQRKHVCSLQSRARCPLRPHRWHGPALPISFLLQPPNPNVKTSPPVGHKSSQFWNKQWS